MTAEELEAVDPRFMVGANKLADLEAWVEAHYPDRLTTDMLGDPAVHRQSLTALDELTALLGLGSLYDFQRA